MKKLITLLTSITIAVSFTACSNDSGTSKKEKGSVASNKAASTKEEAVKNYYEAFSSGNIDKIFGSMAPKDYLDYCVKETGLPDDRLFYRLGRIGSDDDFDECVAYHKEILSGLDGLKIDDSWLDEESDSAYFDVNKSMHNAGIKSNIEKFYYIDPPSGIDVAYEDMSEEERKEEEERLQTPGIDIKDGFLYLLDGKWYYGPEWLLEDFIEVGVEGYDALPESREIHYRNYYNSDETKSNINDYENSENTEYNSALKSESINLCADSSNWTNWSSEENGCAANLKVLSDGAALEITKSHGSGGEQTYYYYNMLKYENITLEKNATYLLEFDIEATGDIDFGYGVQKNYDPYTLYIGDVLCASSDVSHYSFEFTMTESDNNAAIGFNLNCPNVAVPYSVSIHNLTLTRIS